MTVCHLWFMEEWKEHQCMRFNKTLSILDINIFIVKSLQVLIFMFVIFMLCK